MSLFPAATDAEVPGALDRVVTDVAFVAPARTVARSMAQVKSKAFLYHFTRVRPAIQMTKLGAFHAAEIPYVFGHVQGLMGMWEEDRALSKAMSVCWVQFARTGDPNGESRPEWPAHDAVGDQYMEFGDKIKASSGLRKEACDLFDKIQGERFAGRN